MGLNTRLIEAKLVAHLSRDVGGCMTLDSVLPNPYKILKRRNWQGL